MSSVARTSATGRGAMLPDLLAWSSSLALDRALAREDLLGSAAHVTMLAQTGLVSPEDARALRSELLSLFHEAEAGTLQVSDGEEDIHMAIEAELGRRLGAMAGRLHTARSRNDQVALDLHLHIRAQAGATLRELALLIAELAERAERDQRVILPAYTHRQRAQPVSAGFLLLAWATQLLRAADLVALALDHSDISPLGSGACSGTSLPIDRAIVARLLGFSGVTSNALDTVGDRDFALDWTWSIARVLLALSRLATDIIDFSTSEFGFVTLDGEIAAGSSMMPQKKNPDVFELVRGKSAQAVGHVVSLLVLVKGLPTGYNRDLQEDRAIVLASGPLVQGALHAVRTALPHVHFNAQRCAEAVSDGSTQATDLAETLVRRGVPFREAYKAVGELVRAALDAKLTLSSITPAFAIQVHQAFDEQALKSLSASVAVAAKQSIGGTGALATPLAQVRAAADRHTQKANCVPGFSELAHRLTSEPLEPRR